MRKLALNLDLINLVLASGVLVSALAADVVLRTAALHLLY